MMLQENTVQINQPNQNHQSTIGMPVGSNIFLCELTLYAMPRRLRALPR